jgi:hypothetical protein
VVTWDYLPGAAPAPAQAETKSAGRAWWDSLDGTQQLGVVLLAVWALMTLK